MRNDTVDGRVVDVTVDTEDEPVMRLPDKTVVLVMIVRFHHVVIVTVRIAVVLVTLP